MPTAELPRRWAWPALAVVLVGGLALRLWGVAQGLPYAYNVDEADHFVPKAVAMFGHDLNPHYFANPPAFTYLLHFLFAVAYGGKLGVHHAFALHPAEVYTLARVVAAVLGVAALWVLYATGARLFGRAVGLLAAAIEAVAFLPVFYSHLALNDVPTLAPLTVSLLGSAGVLSKGRRRDYLIAGVGLGLACATKYTAGIALAPFLAVAGARYLQREPHALRDALAGLAICAGAALLCFFVANPFSLLDYSEFHHELVHQSTLSAEAQGKLGAPRDGGLAYYLWSLTWGLGWLPAIAALGGAIVVWRRGARYGWMLVPAPLLFLAFMGLQGRYFGRWLLPIFPLLCLLAAIFVLSCARALAHLIARRLPARRDAQRDGEGAGVGNGGGDGRDYGEGEARPRPRGSRLPVALAVLLAALVLAQGLVFSVHSGLVLSRADTRNLTRKWMLANVPARSLIVAEPVSPDEWAREVHAGHSTRTAAYRWLKYPSRLSRISASGALLTSGFHIVGIEDYELTLSPALLGYYREHGYCIVVSGSTESGRAFANGGDAPLAVAYYRALRRQGEVIFRASPYAPGKGPVSFGFDWSFDYYPLAYRRPGPSITVYRLHGGRCGR